MSNAIKNSREIGKHQKRSHRALARLSFSEKVKMVIANQKVMEIFRKARKDNE